MTTPTPRDKALATAVAISAALMTVGGVIAWGLGGALFGFGLWLAIACIAEETRRGGKK